MAEEAKKEDPMAGLGALLGALSKEIEKTKHFQHGDKIKFPVNVKKVVGRNPQPQDRGSKCGSFVSIRPVADEYENKTFLGIYMGEFCVQNMIAYDPEKEELLVNPNTNPGIFVPDLNKMIYGMESWWGEIESEEDLKQITDADIQNIWYVKALKELDKKEDKDELDKH